MHQELEFDDNNTLTKKGISLGKSLFIQIKNSRALLSLALGLCFFSVLLISTTVPAEPIDPDASTVSIIQLSPFAQDDDFEGCEA